MEGNPATGGREGVPPARRSFSSAAAIDAATNSCMGMSGIAVVRSPASESVSRGESGDKPRPLMERGSSSQLISMLPSSGGSELGLRESMVSSGLRPAGGFGGVDLFGFMRLGFVSGCS
jgi:hypothetical protein